MLRIRSRRRKSDKTVTADPYRSRAGCGFIGRNLVEYLLDNDLVSYVRVVDKVPPQTAWLNVRHQRLFEHPLLEFKSTNLINTGNNVGGMASGKNVRT